MFVVALIAAAVFCVRRLMSFREVEQLAIAESSLVEQESAPIEDPQQNRNRFYLHGHFRL